MIYRIYLLYEGFHIFKKYLSNKKVYKHFSSDRLCSRIKLEGKSDAHTYLRVMIINQIEINSQLSHAFKCFLKHKSAKTKKMDKKHIS